MKNLACAAAVLLASSTLAAPAGAVTVVTGSNYTFDWSGVCTDCRGTATAHLNVRNYVLGQALTTANFVSFTYDGTNLVAPFALTSVTSMSGNLGGTAGQYSFNLSDGVTTFQTSGSPSIGPWTLIVPVSTAASDFGASSIWALNAVAGVPEPATWAMMIAGFGLVGSALRRRSSVRFAIA